MTITHEEFETRLSSGQRRFSCLDLSKQVFSSVKILDEINFSRSSLVGADLSGCSLKNAVFSDADFFEADLSNVGECGSD